MRKPYAWIIISQGNSNTLKAEDGWNRVRSCTEYFIFQRWIGGKIHEEIEGSLDSVLINTLYPSCEE